MKEKELFVCFPILIQWASIGRDSLAEDIVSFVAQHVDSMGKRFFFVFLFRIIYSLKKKASMRKSLSASWLHSKLERSGIFRCLGEFFFYLIAIGSDFFTFPVGF